MTGAPEGYYREDGKLKRQHDVYGGPHDEPPSVITWHLDPTVAERAVFGRHEALLWWTGPGARMGWLVYQVGGLDPLDQGTGTDGDDAKRQAETVLRRLAD